MGPRFGKSRVFWLTQLSLILAPMFKIGYNMDFSMRASIPALCVLCVFVIRFLTEEHSGARRKVSAALLAVLLMIGAVTPLEEFRRGIYKVREADVYKRQRQQRRIPHIGGEIIADRFAVV